MEVVWITDAAYEGGYNVRLTFNDGKSGLVDLKPYTERKPFEPLKDTAVLRDFTLNDWTLSWLDGRIDIAPESLYHALC